MQEATRALTIAMAQIGPKVLTWRQLGQGAAFYAREALMGKKKQPAAASGGTPSSAPAAATDAAAAGAAGAGGSSTAAAAAAAVAHEAAAAAPAGDSEATGPAADGASDPDADAAAIAAAIPKIARAASGRYPTLGASPTAGATAAGPKRVSLIPKPPTGGFQPCFAESTAKHWLLHAGAYVGGGTWCTRAPTTFPSPNARTRAHTRAHTHA